MWENLSDFLTIFTGFPLTAYTTKTLMATITGEYNYWCCLKPNIESINIFDERFDEKIGKE